MFFKKKTVLHKFIISYTIVVIIITFLLSISSYYFFQKAYSEEVELVYAKIMDYTQKNLQSTLVNNTEEIYTQLFSQQPSYVNFSNNLNKNSSKIVDIHDQLKTIVNHHSDIIDAIHIYYIDFKLLISSTLGMKINDNLNSGIFNNMDWYNKIRHSDKSNVWVDTRETSVNLEMDPSEIPDPTQIRTNLTYVRTYPFASTGKTADCYIAIDLKEGSLSSLLHQSTPSQYDAMYLINPSGVILSSFTKDLLHKQLLEDDDIQLLIKQDASPIMRHIKGSEHIIFSRALADTPYHIISVVSVSRYYEKIKSIQTITFIIGTLSIIIGIIISINLSARMYSPIRKVVKRINPPQDGSENEYSIIHNTLDTLNNRINLLQQNIDENLPIIKHTLISNLFNHIVFDKQDLQQQLGMLNLNLNKDYYVVLVVYFDTIPLWNQLAIAQKQIIKYSLLKRIESYKVDNIECVGTELSEASIGILINTPTTESAITDRLCDHAVQYMDEYFSFKPSLMLGTSENNLLECYTSYNQAQKLYDYYYFYPDNTIFDSRDFMERIDTPSSHLDNYITSFIEHLNAQNKDLTMSNFVAIIEELTSNPYTSDYCNQLLLQLLRIFANYTNKLKYEVADSFNTHVLYSEFKKLRNITEFKVWFTEYIEKVIDFLHQQQDTKNNQLIQKVQQYILKNLDKDISLDIIADQIGITPRYLSKLFKDESGINFSAYLTQVRMETAEKMLTETNLSVEQIANQVGYNTPSYFIQKFKKTYGYTPNNYRKAKIHDELS